MINATCRIQTVAQRITYPVECTQQHTVITYQHSIHLGLFWVQGSIQAALRSSCGTANMLRIIHTYLGCACAVCAKLWLPALQQPFILTAKTKENSTPSSHKIYLLALIPRMLTDRGPASLTSFTASSIKPLTSFAISAAGRRLFLFPILLVESSSVTSTTSMTSASTVRDDDSSQEGLLIKNMD